MDDEARLGLGVSCRVKVVEGGFEGPKLVVGGAEEVPWLICEGVEEEKRDATHAVICASRAASSSLGPLAGSSS